jgi:BON domain
MRGKSWAFLGGLGLGALAMYFLDPTAGDRRRAVARDKFLKTTRRARTDVERRAKNLTNRAKGVAARTRSHFESDNPTDEVLAQRVRTALGRVISHPRLIGISAESGVVTLSGSVIEEESNALSQAVRKVRGVRDVVDQTEVREEALR